MDRNRPEFKIATLRQKFKKAAILGQISYSLTKKPFLYINRGQNQSVTTEICAWGKASGGPLFDDSAVATGRPGGLYPPNDCLCPPLILVYSQIVFTTSRNDTTTDNNGKRKDNVQT